MSYKRVDTQDGVTVMNKDLYDNLQDGIEQFGVTPEMFGAVGDGVHDDTEAFQDAIRHLSKGGILYLPTSKYLVSQPIEIPEGILVQGGGQKTTTIIVSKNFEGNFLLKFLDISKGGGLLNVSMDGNYVPNITGVIIGSSKDNVSVNNGFVVAYISIRNFTKNSLEYLSGWQATFHDIYISGGDVGFLIEGADTTFHDINISGCDCGLYLNTGTAKINNVKIDNCNAQNNTYSCILRGERNNICNLEIQNCGPNGLYVSGSHNSYYGIILDKIGILLDGSTFDEGSVVTFSSNNFCKYDFHIINTHIGLDLATYSNAGVKGKDLNYLWNLLKTNDINIFSDVSSIFSKQLKSKSFEVPTEDLHNLINKGVLSIPTNQNTNEFPVYASNFTLKITGDIVKNIGSYKAAIVYLDFTTNGTPSYSIYKGEEPVVKESIQIENNPFIQYAVLKEGVTDFNIYASSTQQIELKKIKVILFQDLCKNDWLFI